MNLSKKELEIEIELEDKNAEYKIVGNENLINGSKVKIRITSESGLTKEYVFNINKEEVKEEKEKPIIIIPLVILIFSIIVLIITIIFVRKRKNNKKNYQ